MSIKSSRKHLVLLVVLLMALALGHTTALADVPRVETDEPITLVWAIPGNPQEVAVYQQLADNFMKANPNVTIRTDREASDFTKAVTLIAGDMAPDVLFFTINNWAAMAGQGVLEPLDSYIERENYDIDDFYPQIIKPYLHDGNVFGQGRLYGLPKEIAVRAFYYNRPMWLEAGLGEPDPYNAMTWDEYLAALTKLVKKEGRRTTQYGLVSESWWGIWAIWGWANGGEMVDNPWNPTRGTMDDPKVIEGFSWFVDLAQKHGVMVPTEIADQQGKSEMFAGQRAASYFNGRWMVPLFRESSGLDFDVMPTPRGSAGPAQLLTGSMFGISATSKHKEAAWKLLSYVVGQEGQLEMTKLGMLLPSRRSIAESDEFLLATPPTNNHVFLSDLEHARILPMHKKYREMEKAVGDEMMLALNGDKAVEDALKAANAKVTTLLQED